MCIKASWSNDTFKLQYLSGSITQNEENASHGTEIPPVYFQMLKSILFKFDYILR